MHHLPIFLTAALCMSAAMAQDTQAGQRANPPGQQQADNQNRSTSNLQQFVEKAAQIHMTEAHLAELAKTRANSGDLKKQAEQVQQENRDAYERLTQISKQFAFTIPQAIDSEHQQQIKSFEGLSSGEFDKHYKQHATKEFQRRAEWFRSESGKLDNSDLKQYASSQASALEQRYNRLQALDLQRRTTTASTASNNSPTSSEADRSATAARADSADRFSSAGRSASAGMQHGETHGTVTAFERGKTLKVKFRNRIGQHEYELTGANLHASVPDDLKPGNQVVVREEVDRNGFRTLEVTADTSTGIDSAAGQRSSAQAGKP